MTRGGVKVPFPLREKGWGGGGDMTLNGQLPLKKKKLIVDAP